jgi:hypothetical protein
MSSSTVMNAVPRPVAPASPTGEARCTVCTFSFGETFSPLGEGFTHVHHLRPVSTAKEQHEVDPVADVRTVCPHCHAMLHRTQPPMSIHALRHHPTAVTSPPSCTQGPQCADLNLRFQGRVFTAPLGSHLINTFAAGVRMVKTSGETPDDPQLYPMNITLRTTVVFFLSIATSAFAQDTAPTSISGKTAVVVISSGTGSFSAVGGYRISFSATNATYTVTPLSSTVLPGAGVYAYIKTGANTGRLTVTDASVGVGVAQTIIFTTPTTGTYSVSSAFGAQTGTLVWENVSVINGSSGSGLSNMSVRAVVPSGSQIIPGIVLDSPSRLLIRVAGPALANFGVSGTLPNPKFTVMSGSNVVAANDDWSSTAQNQSEVTAAVARTGAFAFAPGSRDAAVVVDLNPGNYTCIINGGAGTTGEVILEVYRVQ